MIACVTDFRIILKRFLVKNEDASRILLSVLKEYTKRHRIRPGKSHLLPHNQAEATLKLHWSQRQHFISLHMYRGEISNVGFTFYPRNALQLHICFICAFYKWHQVTLTISLMWIHFTVRYYKMQWMFTGVERFIGRKATAFEQDVTNLLWKYECKETLCFMKEHYMRLR